MVTVAQAQALVSASKLIAVMLMCSGSLGDGEGMLIGVLLLLSRHFGSLQAPGLVRQNDVGEHLW